MKKFSAAVFAFLLCLSALAQAKTLKFPQKHPEFSVTFPNDWKAEITSAGIISAQPKGAAYAISIFPVQASTAQGAIEETMKEVDKRFSNIQANDPVEFRNEGGLKFLESDMTAKDKSEARTLAIVAFSIDRETYYALFQAGTPEADKQYTQAVISIVSSIAPLKSNRD